MEIPANYSATKTEEPKYLTNLKYRAEQLRRQMAVHASELAKLVHEIEDMEKRAQQIYTLGE